MLFGKQANRVENPGEIHNTETVNVSIKHKTTIKQKNKNKMKRIFTLVFAVLAAIGMKAQMHGALNFVGASKVSVMTTVIENPSDTVSFVMNDMTTGSITLPAMKGMSTIPSFTIENVKFSMGANHVVSFSDQTFTAKAEADGAEKQIIGSSLSGEYNMADNSLTLKAVFKYGAMPMEMTYEIKSYYLKAISGAINVSVGGVYNYSNDNVTYKLRKYTDGSVEKVDVEVPTYTLDNTIMGNITLGSYVIKGLAYSEEKGGFYHDYKGDGLSFHFMAESGGTKTMDGIYQFNPEKENNILVVYSGSQITSIENAFQVGAMPFPITSTFNNATNAVDNIEAGKPTVKDGNMYDLNGQRVGSNAKGIVIVNGKKYLRR